MCCSMGRCVVMWRIAVWSIPGLFSSVSCGIYHIHLAEILLIPRSLHRTKGIPSPNRNISNSYPIFVRRSESNSSLTVLIFFVEMDEGRPGLGSSVTELLPCFNLLYHLYKAVFITELFLKAVFNNYQRFLSWFFVCYTNFNRRLLFKVSHFAYSDYLCHVILFDVEQPQIKAIV